LTDSPLPASPSVHDLPIDNMRGAFWMLAGVVFFAATAILIKYAGQTLHTFEIVFFRCVFGMIVVIPLLAQSGLSALRVHKPAIHILRVFCAVGGMMGGFYALTHLELATAISLSFTRPLFMILLAVLFLGERIRWRRGLATLVGFTGVLIMVQPGSVNFEPAFATGLFAALAVAGALVTVKMLATHDAPVTIMLTFSIGTVVVSIIPATLVWQMPTGNEWLILMGLGTVASLGQYSMIRAFTIGEATVMSPIDYLQILLGSSAGYFLFQEKPSVSTFIGAVIIVGATLYIVLRGAKMQAPLPLPPDPGAASLKGCGI
jgi:drug/metabolite transporter (DMT)-like permease